jgi:hypothetical protein
VLKYRKSLHEDKAGSQALHDAADYDDEASLIQPLDEALGGYF